MCLFATAMEELLCELRLFLDLLDREYLSAGVRERKLHLSNILHRVLAEKGKTRGFEHKKKNLVGTNFQTITCEISKENTKVFGKESSK